MADEDAADKENVDIVTDIQRKLGNLLGLMYSCTGAIQRDAPAASVRGEQAQPRSSAPLGDTATMAQEIVEASQSIDTLIQKLPRSFGLEEEELQNINALQKERADICRGVQASWEYAEQALLEGRSGVLNAVVDSLIWLAKSQGEACMHLLGESQRSWSQHHSVATASR